MKPQKRKGPCTSKREIPLQIQERTYPLDNQERIYPLPWLRGWRGKIGNWGNSSMPKDPMEKPDYPGEVGGFCPRCKERDGIEVPTIARRQHKTGKLYFGCPNFDPPHNCRFNGCRDVVSE
jgi:hypothetical protein